MAVALRVVGLRHVIHSGLTLQIEHFELQHGELHVLLGANGAGKSTFFGLLSGQIQPETGEVFLSGKSLSKLNSKLQARQRAVLSQEHESIFRFTVEEIVAMGRYPWVGTAEEFQDGTVVDTAMRNFEIADFAQRPADVLSGGEKARVAMARISAQSTPVMLLDEPTAALDLKHQISLLKSVKEFTSAGGIALVIVHDINRALEFADVISFLHEGKIIASGVPEKILTAEIIQKTYDVAVDVRPHPLTGRLNVTPLV